MIDYKKQCVICDEKINFQKDTFVRLTDFTGKKQTGECFYHLACWKRRFEITQEKITKNANMWMDKLTSQIGEIIGGDKTVFVK
jgi:hypothetical protein